MTWWDISLGMFVGLFMYSCVVVLAKFIWALMTVD
jgi:hypothetical protein